MWLPLLAASLVVVPAVLPLVVGFLPRLYFETDPRAGYDPAMLTMFGPAGAVVLHCLSIAAAGLALTIYTALGGKLQRAVLVLAGVGCALAAWQASQHSGNLLTMSAWIAGASLAVAAAHLGRMPAARRWMIAVVIAMMVPVGLQASYDVLIQKPRDIAWWHANSDELLAHRGVAPGSSEHQLLERRAMSNDADGPFGFSNALGTLAGGGAVSALCVGIGGIFARDKRAKPASLAALCAGGCGLGAVWFTHSTGAMGAVGIGSFVVAVSWWLARLKKEKAIPLIALLVLTLAILVVIVRGAIGPPDSMAGERSLLFRFHYWQAAVRIMADQLPSSALFGVGPTGFAQGYLQHKNPINPENIASTHSVMVDWITMLGIGGLAWFALAVGWVVQAGRAVGRTAQGETALAETVINAPPVSLLQRPTVLIAMLIAAIVFGTQYALQSAMMDIELAMLWLVGMIGFAIVLATLGADRSIPPRYARLGLLGLALVVLIHSQIEMAFALMVTAGTAWFLIGLAGAGEDTTQTTHLRLGRTTLSVLVATLVVAASCSIWIAAPIVRHQSHLAQASQWLASGENYRAITSLEKAGAVLPENTTATRWIVALRRDEMLAMQAKGDMPAARNAFDLAMHPINAHIKRGDTSALIYRLRISLLLESAAILDDPALRDEAVLDMSKLAGLSPFNLRDAVIEADVLWEMGDRKNAMSAYQRALQIDADLYLDDAMQLNARERERIERRVRQGLPSDTGTMQTP